MHVCINSQLNLYKITMNYTYTYTPPPPFEVQAPPFSAAIMITVVIGTMLVIAATVAVILRKIDVLNHIAQAPPPQVVPYASGAA